MADKIYNILSCKPYFIFKLTINGRMISVLMMRLQHEFGLEPEAAQRECFDDSNYWHTGKYCL